MTYTPNYLVLRPHPDLPPCFLPPHMDGQWLDGNLIPTGFGSVDNGEAEAVAVPTGRFEVRDSDGAVAEVWEVRP